MESPEHDDDRLRTMALVLAEAEHRVKTSITIISAWASTLDDRWDALTREDLQLCCPKRYQARLQMMVGASRAPFGERRAPKYVGGQQ